MAIEIEIIPTKRRDLTLIEVIDGFNEINTKYLKSFFCDNYLDSAKENDKELMLNQNLNSYSLSTEFFGQFSQNCILWKNTEPYDEFNTAEDLIVESAKFNRDDAKLFASRASALNFTYKLTWLFSNNDRLFGFAFILCLCELLEALVYNVYTDFNFIGCYTTDQWRAILINELGNSVTNS
ncbi:hypothetical protein V6R21_15485 [Limibacter armeniacum]|uniref:hypothetical protein n=1 Tax=Limibacter armeniacum TaxID=466084 RepID=UPI002FE4FD9F